MGSTYKNRQYFRLQTQSGAYFDVTDMRAIVRLDMDFEPSATWTAICLRDRYDRIVGRFDRENTIPIGDQRFKNGKGRLWLQDFDHGTMRQWGDRIVHIWAYNMPKVVSNA